MPASDLPHSLSRRHRGTAALLLGEAATVAVFSGLHLAGVLHPGGGSGNADGAGIAEALICAALLAGAWWLARGTAHGRRIALLAVGFAIFGFMVGLNFTVRGGDALDLAYHATMLPILIGTLALLVRDGRRGAGLPAPGH